MLLKIGLGVAGVLAVFLVYVSLQESKFHYERSGVIDAPADKIYPYISNLKMGSQWSPYEKIDPNMKKTFKGDDGQVGAVMEFEGNSDAGSGRLEVISLVPNEKVEIRLLMTQPMAADNLVTYTLVPEGDATRFIWSMSGDGGFMGKLISVLIDCEKMIGDQFSEGIANLKTVVESKT